MRLATPCEMGFRLAFAKFLCIGTFRERIRATNILFPGPEEKRFVWQGPRISMVSTQIFGTNYSDFGDPKFTKMRLANVLGSPWGARMLASNCSS